MIQGQAFAEWDEVNTRRVDPYRLLLFGGDPYVVGHDHLRRAFRTFGTSPPPASPR